MTIVSNEFFNNSDIDQIQRSLRSRQRAIIRGRELYRSELMATSARNLVNGAGTVSITSGSRALTFSQNQSFKEGTTINISGIQAFTLDVGSGTMWTAMQGAASTASTQSFQTSDPSTSRSRGGAGGGISGIIVPNAIHYVYRAALDDSGNPDWYFYFDTLFPENGVQPYTHDQYTGNNWRSAPGGAIMVPDLLTRVRRLEGIGRAATADPMNPDSRFDDIITRIYNLEVWANSGGHFGTPPAAGSNATFTIDQLTSYGDPL